MTTRKTPRRKGTLCFPSRIDVAKVWSAKVAHHRRNMLMFKRSFNDFMLPNRFYVRVSTVLLPSTASAPDLKASGQLLQADIETHFYLAHRIRNFFLSPWYARERRMKEKLPHLAFIVGGTHIIYENYFTLPLAT